jgi:hypothetical protein
MGDFVVGSRQVVIVAFRSAKGIAFAERKPTIAFAKRKAAFYT